MLTVKTSVTLQRMRCRQSFVVDDENLFILKWDLKIGRDFHDNDYKSTIPIPVRDNGLLKITGKFGVCESVVKDRQGGTLKIGLGDLLKSISPNTQWRINRFCSYSTQHHYYMEQCCVQNLVEIW